MSERIHNFNPGPAALPLKVLERIQGELLNYRGAGMSILEISHRSDESQEILARAKDLIKKLLKLPENYHILFLQGGASTQFYMIPENFLTADTTADYVNTGTWSTKAINEANILGFKINVVASSEDRDFRYIPKNIIFTPEAKYIHLTSNNTIKGTQWSAFPETGGTPLVADMSSDIFSRSIDVSPFGLIYAGAQKNLGPAGITLVIIRQDMLEQVRAGLPTMVSYQTHASKDSMYNTPPVFGLYVVGLMLEWLDEDIGGLAAMSALNEKKASLMYDFLDRSGFYQPTADKDSRSLMNVTFRLPTVDLEKHFVAEAKTQGLAGLKGHRSVGGCRASIYNAVPMEAVRDLLGFMEEFMRTNG